MTMSHPSYLTRIALTLVALFVGSLCSLVWTLSAHASAPNGFTSQTYSDANGDGTIDRITVVINGGEALSACTVDAGELASDWTYTGGATFGGSIASASCTAGTATIVFTISGATASVTGGGTAPTIAYDNDDGDNSIANASGNLGTVAAASASDAAAPVIVTVSPTNVGASRSSTIIVTFSEAMDTTFAQDTEFTVSPNVAGTWTVTWSGSDKTATLDAPGIMPCGVRHVVTLALDQIDAATGSVTDLVATGPEDNSFNFTTASCGSNPTTDEETRVVTPQLRLLSPAAATTANAGDTLTLAWEDTSVNTSIPFVTISYTVNGGASTTIANNLPAQRTPYTWTVPDVTGNIVVTIRGTDLLTTLYTLTAPAITVGSSADELEEETMIEEDEIMEVPTYIFVRAVGSNAVYALDQYNVRHPFYNSAIFFTWADSFRRVVEVSASELGEMEMGAPMAPRAGTVLVKIESAAKVYALEADNAGVISLRWISSEEVARELFGSAWADYVIDLPVTLFPRLGIGDDILSADDYQADRSIMHTRAHLHR